MKVIIYYGNRLELCLCKMQSVLVDRMVCWLNLELQSRTPEGKAVEEKTRRIFNRIKNIPRLHKFDDRHI